MFTDFDVFIIVIIIISSLIGFVRGLIKELLSVASWIGAGLITLFAFPSLNSVMDELFKSSVVINVVSIMVVFMVVLGLISLVNAMVLDNLRGFRMGAADRSMGTLFGLLRGIIIISIIHFAIVTIHDDKEEPEWLTEGETYGLSRFGGEIVKDFAMTYINEGIAMRRQQMSEEMEEMGDGLEEEFEERFE